MTHFKLYLLTPQFRDNVTVFLEDQIAEFYAQLDQDQSRQAEIFNADEKTATGSELSVFEERRKELWENNHNSFSYTYNEKITKEQNAQKTLTFEMNRYIATTNEWRENPFARNIMVGSILLLKEFRFKEVSEEILFTVKTIKYNFKQNNTIYSIECQDSFTYQSARQNDGYTITNDPESHDFIGAKTIDWWIINKIKPECHMNYDYLSMQTGLYLTQEGHYYTFDINEYDNIPVPNNEHILKIIKEPYSPERDKDYFESFSFSCSGSNANAALIALADLINFQINTFEHGRKQDLIVDLVTGELVPNENRNIFDQYFWVEPKQNDQRVGLQYSPAQSIKSFGLTHRGDSLTTILNVEGPTVDDELISLIPSVPAFFASFFLSGAKWDKSSFNKGFFTNLCKERFFTNYEAAVANPQANIFEISTNTVNMPAPEEYMTPQERTEAFIRSNGYYDSDLKDVCGWFDEEYRYFPIYTNRGNTAVFDNSSYLFSVPNIYNLITFTHDKLSSRLIQESIDPSDPEILMSIWRNTGSHWELVIYDLETQFIYFIKENDQFQLAPSNHYRVFIRIKMSEDIDNDHVWGDPLIYLSFYRNPSAEDLEFARIADTCPWLENKIIDFNYFYINRIITEHEYQELMDIVNNQLRIVNGKLLIYAQAYYNALHQETEILANLQNKLDVLGAECQASIIDPCANAVAPQIDLSHFKSTYFDIINYTVDARTPILDHTTLLEEYYSKYFNAQQRFLKNIKNFKEFFEQTVDFAAEGLYNYNFTIDLPSFEKLILQQANQVQPNEDGSYTAEITFYSFANANFKDITSSFQYYIGYARNHNGEDIDDQTVVGYGEPQVPIYQYTDDKGYVRINVASERNYKSLYLPKIHQGDVIQIGSDDDLIGGLYNPKLIYYEPTLLVNIHRVKVEDPWYLDCDNTNYLKISTTTDLTFSNNPTVYPWKGLYHIIYSNGGPLNEYYFIGERIIISKNDKLHGQLVLKWLPTSSNPLLTDVWRDVNSLSTATIQLTYLNDSGELTDGQWATFTLGNTIDTDLQPVSKKQAINNWLYRQVFNELSTNCYAHNYEYYEPLGSTAIPTWFTDNARKTLLASFVQGDDINAVNNNAWDSSATELYKKYFPVQNLYYYGPKYDITPQEAVDKYLFKRLNEKGQDQKDYFEAIQTGLNVTNPFNYQAYQPIKFVTPLNEKEFFRRVRGTVAGKIWSGVGTGIVAKGMFVMGLGFLGAAALNTYFALWKYGPNWFAREGLCSNNFFNTSIEEHSGYHDWNSLVYTIAENSYSTYEALKDAAIKANGSTASVEIAKWNDYYYQFAPTQLNQNTMTLATASELELTDETNPFFYAFIGKHIGATWSRASTYFYPRSDARFLNGGSYINKNGKYRIIWWDSNSTNPFIRNELYGSLEEATDGLMDLVRYYPVTNIMMPFDVSNLDWTQKDRYTIYEALVQNGYSYTEDSTEGNHHFKNVQFTGNGSSTDRQIFKEISNISIVEIQDFKRELLPFDSSTEEWVKWVTHYPLDSWDISHPYYDLDNIPIDFNNVSHLMDGYYYIANSDDAFYQINSVEEIPPFTRNETYYDENYNRVYTIYELMHEAPFRSCYLQCQSYNEELLSKFVTTFTPTLIKNTALVTFTKDNSHILTPIITSYRINSLKTNPDSNIYTLNFQDDDILHLPINDTTITISKTVNKISDIHGLTNGAFWYLYHNNLDHPLLLQHAAVIEAKLSEYWQTAYIASKYCEYFLPEHWQPMYDTKINNFASQIFSVNYGADSELQLKLSSTFIPEIHLVEDLEGNTQLTRYHFKRMNRVVQYTPTNKHGIYIDEINEFEAKKVCQDNPAIVNALTNLGDSLNNWYVEANGKTTYYYADANTGMTWQQFLTNATKQYFEQYSGQYIMLYKILFNQYRELPMTEYHKYQEQHNHLWNTLYNKYQFMILQNSYKNENATSSTELLQMAQYAFKHQSNPEAEYSLSILNSAELRDLEGRSYYGQEIRIGDGIKLDAQAYYNEYDQIYRSLSQYLFISKISYSLRNPIDISLTVNDVQYEDKIVQRLVKLIK